MNLDALQQLHLWLLKVVDSKWASAMQGLRRFLRTLACNFLGSQLRDLSIWFCSLSCSFPTYRSCISSCYWFLKRSLWLPVESRHICKKGIQYIQTEGFMFTAKGSQRATTLNPPTQPPCLSKMLPDTLERSWGPWTAATYDHWRLVGFVMRIFQSLFKDVFKIHLEWSSWIISVATWNSCICAIPWCFWQFASGLSQFPFRENPAVSDQPAICPQPWWNSLASLHGTFGSKHKSTMWMCPHVAHWKNPQSQVVASSLSGPSKSLCTSKQRSAHLGGNELTGTAWSLTHTDGPGLSRVNPCGPSA